MKSVAFSFRPMRTSLLPALGLLALLTIVTATARPSLSDDKPELASWSKLTTLAGADDRPEHWTALNHSIAVNHLLGHSDRLAMTMRDGHSPTAKFNEQAFRFLEHFLGQPSTVAHSAAAADDEKATSANEPPGADSGTVRVATCQAQARTINWRITEPADVLAAVDRNLDELDYFRGQFEAQLFQENLLVVGWL